VWRPATPEQQRDSLRGIVEPPSQLGLADGTAALVGEAEAEAAATAAAAAAAAAGPAATASPAELLGAAVELGRDATLFADEDDLDVAGLADATYAASTGAPTLDAAAANAASADAADAPSSPSPPRRRRPEAQTRRPRSANAPRGPRLERGGGEGRAAGRSLRQFGGGGLPPTTTASHAPPVKVGACGLAELSGGSRVASPGAVSGGGFGWALAVSKGADVMAVGQPGVEVVDGFADYVSLYREGNAGSAFVFAAVPGGGGAAVSLRLAKSCTFADQRLINPVWRVDKEVVGFGTEVALSFKGDVALAAGRLIPNPAAAGGDDDGSGGGGDPLNWSQDGTDMVWAFKRGVTGYVQFSRQEMPLINPPAADGGGAADDDGAGSGTDDGGGGERRRSRRRLSSSSTTAAVLRRVMALGLSHDGGLAMAAYLSVDRDNPAVSLSEAGGGVQIFGSTRERYLLTQAIGPPRGARAQSWAVAAALSADSGTLVASDGSGPSTLAEDDQLRADGVRLEDGSGVFVFSRTDGLALTKPDGKVGLVQSNATARYTLAGLLRPPLWTEEAKPGAYDATATFGTAVAVTAKARFVAVVERRYVAAHATAAAARAAAARAGAAKKARAARATPALSAAGSEDDYDDGGSWAVAHFVHVYQRVDGTGKGLTAMYALKCTLDDPDPHRYAPFGYGRHQLSVATDGKTATVAIGSQPSTGTGAQRGLPSSVYVYRIVAGQTAGKGEDICPFEPEFVVDDPMFVGGGSDDDGGGGADDDGSGGGGSSSARPSFYGEAVALSADGQVLVVGAPETAVAGEDGSVYLYDLRKPVKKDVYVGNAPLVGVSKR